MCMLLNIDCDVSKVYLRYFCAYDVNRIDSVYKLRVSKKKFKTNLTADDIIYSTISKHACSSVFFQTENNNVYHIIYYATCRVRMVF